MVTAGLELTALKLAGYSEVARPTSGTFNARVGQGRWDGIWPADGTPTSA